MNITPKLGKRLGRVKDAKDTRDSVILENGLRAYDGAARYKQEILTLAPLPSSVDVFHGLSLPVYDQGELGSCSANAGVLYRRFLAQKFSKYSAPDKDLSRLFLYYQERLLEGTEHEDAGAQIRDTFKTLAKVGVCTEQCDPYNPPTFANPLANDSSADLESAAIYRIGAYHRIPDVNTARSVLASGYAIELGFVVYESFESIGSDGVMPMPKVPGEQVLGGHAVVIRGYDDTNSRFRIQNSWGPGWGDRGCFWMPYAFLEDTKLSQPDMWMGHLGRPWK